MQAVSTRLAGGIVFPSVEPLKPLTCGTGTLPGQRLHSSSSFQTVAGPRKVAETIASGIHRSAFGTDRKSAADTARLQGHNLKAASSNNDNNNSSNSKNSSNGGNEHAAGRDENPFEGKPAKLNGASSQRKDTGTKPEILKPLPSSLQAEVDKQWTESFPTYMQSREEFETADNWPANPKQAKKPSYDGEAAARAAHIAAAALDGHGGAKLNSLVPPWSAALPPGAGVRQPDLIAHDPLWAAIRLEAKVESEREPLLSSFLYASILAHSCFERSLGFILANRLNNAVFLATQLMDIFDDVLVHDKQIQEAIRADVQAIRDRDPSCHTYSCALLYFKGYHALQAYRIAHALWNRGQKVLAINMQSRISEVFAVDIHPAARIGKGILMDHGTGVVIGETAVVGDRVSLLQGVTLGGTGKDCGDRHPKIADGVLIGAGATILGNIKVGKGAMVAAGSLVLKDVAPKSMVAGTPARVIGESPAKVPALTMDHNAAFDFCRDWEEAVRRQHEMELNNGGGI